MATLREFIEEAAGGEPVLAVVIGRMGWATDQDQALSDDYGHEGVPNYEVHPRGVVLTWEEALPHISYDFDPGFGAPGCEAIHAWTKNRVIGISQYDGSVTPFWLPRRPNAKIEPTMPGG